MHNTPTRYLAALTTLLSCAALAGCGGNGAPLPAAHSPATSSALAAPTPSTSPAAPTATGSLAPFGHACETGQLRLTTGGRVSEATQQNTAVLVLRNESTHGCDLRGYPGITLVDSRGTSLPFRYRLGGDQMLTGAAPAVVPIAPGAAAFVAINKVTCAGRQTASAVRIEVTPPGRRTGLTIMLPHYPILGYCASGDPGRIVDITPVEATEKALFPVR